MRVQGPPPLPPTERSPTARDTDFGWASLLDALPADRMPPPAEPVTPDEQDAGDALPGRNDAFSAPVLMIPTAVPMPAEPAPVVPSNADPRPAVTVASPLPGPGDVSLPMPPNNSPVAPAATAQSPAPVPTTAVPATPIVSTAANTIPATLPTSLPAAAPATSPRPITVHVDQPALDAAPRLPPSEPDAVAVRLQPESGAQSLLYPQRLIANGYLSQLGVDARNATGQASGSAGASAASAVFPSAGSAIALPPPGASSAPFERPAPSLAAMAQAASAEARADEMRASSSRRLQPLLVALPWAPKMLRLAPDADGGVSLWIRDFALDEHSAKQLVQAVRRAAEGSDQSLQRIVLNGQLAWSATQGAP